MKNESIENFLKKFEADDVVLLKNQHNKFKSFRFKTDAKHQKVVLDPNNWPPGIFVKRWYGKLSDENARQNDNTGVMSLLGENGANNFVNNVNINQIDSVSVNSQRNAVLNSVSTNVIV